MPTLLTKWVTESSAFSVASKRLSTCCSSEHAVLVSLHDLTLAARHCTRLILLDRGRVAADGPPLTVLSEARLAEVFHLRGHMLETGDGPLLQAIDVLG